MRQYFGLLTAAILLSIVPASGWAQQDPGIPPMLENRRPMAVPTAKLPPVEQPKATTPKAPKSKKAKSTQRKKVKKVKGRLATKKTKKPAAKKKGVTAKPRGKSKANSS
jgi:hypothetical protein